ncbi:hypothetical protein, partial [Desulfobacter postgatei]|uniref:hypothetical protein n=1 Tax=Desulfobacter postgatei TaxID=2293 RepID=UPI002FDA7EC7
LASSPCGASAGPFHPEVTFTKEIRNAASRSIHLILIHVLLTLTGHRTCLKTVKPRFRMAF